MLKTLKKILDLIGSTALIYADDKNTIEYQQLREAIRLLEQIIKYIEK